MVASEGKKRGRKSKAEKAALENQPVVAPTPKKRGRKPKGGKIVQHLAELPEPVDVSPNVILHLKCSLNDINSNCSTSSVPSYEFTSTKGGELCYQVIDQNEHIVSQEGDIEFDNKKTSTKELHNKLKILEKSLHFNTVPNKNAACFWCTCQFDNPPVFIPRNQIGDENYVYGNFCSPECSTAYLMNENIDTSTKFERYQYLNFLYAKIYGYERNIKPAPNPHYTLSKFCGNLSIHEYRKLTQNDNLLLVIEKPLTRIMPELHEDNNDFLLGNKAIPSNNTLRLKRQSAVQQSKTDILSENFGI